MGLEISSGAWTVIGIAVTVLFGGGGLFLHWRTRDRTDLIFVNNAAISLLETAVSNLDELSVFYEGAKIEQNIVLLQCAFVNSGNTDIADSDCYAPVKLTLPDAYTWSGSVNVQSVNNAKISYAVNGQSLEIAWDLLKPGEHISIDALVEYRAEDGDRIISSKDISSSLIGSLSVEQRIKSLRKVTAIKEPPSILPAWGLVLASLLFVAGAFGLGYPLIKPLVFGNPGVAFIIVTAETSGRAFAEVKNGNVIFRMLDGNSQIKQNEVKEINSAVMVEQEYPYSIADIAIRSAGAFLGLFAFFLINVLEMRDRRINRLVSSALSSFDVT